MKIKKNWFLYERNKNKNISHGSFFVQWQMDCLNPVGANN